MALRKETGYSWRALLSAMATDPDIDLLVAIVWLARRVRGEQMLPFAAVASEIGYHNEFDISSPEDEPAGEDGLPEA